MTSMPKSRAARTPPSTAAFGARSPPIASSATLTIHSLRRLFLDRREFAAPVGSAMAAHVMRHHGFAAIRAGAGIHGAQCVVRAAHVLLGVRGATFGCLHEPFFLSSRLKEPINGGRSSTIATPRSGNRAVRPGTGTDRD